MTVSTELSHEEYVGNGVTTDFNFRFRIFESKHLIVVVADSEGNETTLKNGTDYIIVGAGSYHGGKVVLNKPLPQSWKILLERDLPVVQETDLRNQGKFFAEVHEDAFDYLTMLIQKALGTFSLSLRKPTYLSNYYDAKGNRIANLAPPKLGSDSANKDYVDNSIKDIDSKTLRVKDKSINTLPNTEQRANKILAFDDNGQPITVLPESGSASDVLLELAKPDGVDWIGGAVKQKELSSEKGACLVGINEHETLFDRLKQTFNAASYGLKSENGAEENTISLQKLSQDVMKSGGGIVFIPAGEYYIGIQHRNTPADYDPSVVRAYGVEFNLNLQNLTGDLIIIGYGAKFKLADGLRFGAFNPETGEPRAYSPTSNDYSTRADVGFIFNIVENPQSNIVIKGVSFDGNMSNLILGGQWGDVGRQCDGYGIRVRNYKSLYIESVTIDKMPLDGLYTGDGWFASQFKRPKSTILNAVKIKGCGRDNWSITGNGLYHAIGCDISEASTYEINSNPSAGINIETEAGRVYQVIFDNCAIYNNMDANILTTSKSVEGVRANNCLIYHDDDYLLTTKNNGVWMRGSIVDLYGCTIRNSKILNQASSPGINFDLFKLPVIDSCYITNKGISGIESSNPVPLINSVDHMIEIKNSVIDILNPLVGIQYIQISNGASISNSKILINGEIKDRPAFSSIIGYIRDSRILNSSIINLTKDTVRTYIFDFSRVIETTGTLFKFGKISGFNLTKNHSKMERIYLSANYSNIPTYHRFFIGQEVVFLDSVKTVSKSGVNDDYSISSIVINGVFSDSSGKFKVGDILLFNDSNATTVISVSGNSISTSSTTSGTYTIKFQRVEFQ